MLRLPRKRIFKSRTTYLWFLASSIDLTIDLVLIGLLTRGTVQACVPTLHVYFKARYIADYSQRVVR